MFEGDVPEPTCAKEIYIYLAIRIYMMIHIENEIENYWNTKVYKPNHPISKYISKNRFF